MFTNTTAHLDPRPGVNLFEISELRPDEDGYNEAFYIGDVVFGPDEDGNRRYMASMLWTIQPLQYVPHPKQRDTLAEAVMDLQDMHAGKIPLTLF